MQKGLDRQRWSDPVCRSITRTSGAASYGFGGVSQIDICALLFGGHTAPSGRHISLASCSALLETTSMAVVCSNPVLIRTFGRGRGVDMRLATDGVDAPMGGRRKVI